MQIRLSAFHSNDIQEAIYLLRDGLKNQGSIKELFVWDSGANEGEVWAVIQTVYPNYTDLIAQLRTERRITLDRVVRMHEQKWTPETFQAVLRETFDGA